jgi:hypothetical protein
VISSAATVAACAVAGIGVVVSCTHIYGLSRGHGQNQVQACLLPVSTAALAGASSLVLLYEARNQLATPGLARMMLWAGTTAMAGAGIASGARYGLPGAVISAWPAVACADAVEMAVQFVCRSRAARHEPRTVAERVVVPDEERDAVRAAYEASVRAGAPLAQRVMAVRFGLSCRKIRQLIPECTTYVEDRRRGGAAV